MNRNTMMQIRHQIWQCFSRSADALFELADALMAEASARSLPELSLSALFRRKWSSVYEALEDGRIDTQRWSAIWTAALLKSHEGPVWMSLDATSIARPEAETSPDRGMIYVCNLPHATKPVSVGWQFSTVMLLPERRSSWGAILSQRRICGQQTAVSVGMEQLEQLRPHLPANVRVLADRWYATGAFLLACQRLSIEALVRLKRNRKLYRPAPSIQPGKRGAPRKDGALFQGSKAEGIGNRRPGIEMAERLKRIVAINEEYYYIAHVCRGMALGLRGRLKEGLEEMGQAIVAEPGEYDGYFWQGMLRAYYYRQQAHEQETIAVIEKALEIGLPPVLLLPRYWLEVDQPDFFTRWAKPLLERMDV